MSESPTKRLSLEEHYDVTEEAFDGIEPQGEEEEEGDDWSFDLDVYRDDAVLNYSNGEDEEFGSTAHFAAPEKHISQLPPFKETPAPPPPPSPPPTRRKILIAGSFLLLAVIALIVVAELLTQHPKTAVSGSVSTPKPPTSGGSGSIVTMDDNTTFTYINTFGGTWEADPEQPFTGGGQAQSWSPKISDPWVWGKDAVRGVNLGGWLVIEPFITPALFEKYINKSSTPVIDEWSLCIAMGSNMAIEIEQHYSTFITEMDFAEIAAAGLNFVRIPLGFWAMETMNDEPFLVGTSWQYFLKAIEWGRKYGIRIYLDLHALPGSQNGWNHSGKEGSVNFMNGVMGIANAERALTYLRILVEFISQDQYKDVVIMFGIVNEVLWGTIGQEAVQSFYLKAYNTIRSSTGLGSGNGPYIAIHDGFQGPALWAGFLSGADRLVLDQHPYLAFTGDFISTPDQMAAEACAWAMPSNVSQTTFGVTIAGEFSAAINNCGLWLNGIDDNTTVLSPNCDYWDDWANYNQSTVNSLLQVSLASMDALQNYFFWTWKIGNSTVLGTSSSPLWDYQLGLKRGWIPADPRSAIGHCASVLTNSSAFDGTYAAAATGGPGAGNIPASVASSYPFPPVTLNPSFSGTQMTLLPTYTPTGTLKTLSGPTFTAAPNISVGNGWVNTTDKQPAYIPVAGCKYPDPWNAVNATLPTATCP